MSKLTALIGLARSGKSTFSEKWQLEDDPDGLKRVVVSGDKVRLGLHDHRFIFKAEPMVHAVYQTMVRALLLNPHLHVLMDDTHTTVSSIRNVLNIDDNAEFIYIPCDPATARKRAIDTNQTDLIPVIDRMYDNLEYLIRAKHPDIAIRKDVLRTQEELITKENILASVEEIRNEVKKTKEYADRSV